MNEKAKTRRSSASRSVNWGSILIVLTVLVIIAGAGYFALRVRATQKKDEGGRTKDE